MKKRITALLTCGLCLTGAVGSVSAENESYTVKLRFEAEATENAVLLEDDVVLVDREKISTGEVRFPVKVYIDDPEHKLYAVTAMWETDDEFLTTESLLDPSVDGNAFTYGIQNADGTYTTNSKYKTVVADNGRGMSCYFQTAYPEPLELLGEESDSYPFAEFEAIVIKDSRLPIYTIRFCTKEMPDWQTGLHCTASYVNEGSIIPLTAELEYGTLTVIAGADTILGDVNLDRNVTPTDAAEVLSLYADKAALLPVEITKTQLLAGDINGDGNLTATDAAEILGYYAYSSTTESPVTFRDYLNAKQ